MRHSYIQYIYDGNLGTYTYSSMSLIYACFRVLFRHLWHSHGLLLLELVLIFYNGDRSKRIRRKISRTFGRPAIKDYIKIKFMSD